MSKLKVEADIPCTFQAEIRSLPKNRDLTWLR